MLIIQCQRTSMVQLLVEAATSGPKISNPQAHPNPRCRRAALLLLLEIEGQCPKSQAGCLNTWLSTGTLHLHTTLVTTLALGHIRSYSIYARRCWALDCFCHSQRNQNIRQIPVSATLNRSMTLVVHIYPIKSTHCNLLSWHSTYLVKRRHYQAAFELILPWHLEYQKILIDQGCLGANI